MTTASKSVIAFIPARGESKGIKDKNLSRVGAYSLVEWAVSAALNAARISAVVISSDSDRILEEVRRHVFVNHPNRVLSVHLHKRPEKLAGDQSRIMDTVHEIYNVYDLDSQGSPPVLMLQPTSPFRKKNEVDQFLEKCEFNGGFTPTVSVRKVDDSHPARMYRMTDDGKLTHSSFLQKEEFFPRQQLSTLYLRDGAYYLFTDEMIKKFTPVAPSTRAFVREYPFCINIDTPADLELSRIEYQKIKHEL